MSPLLPTGTCPPTRAPPLVNPCPPPDRNGFEGRPQRRAGDGATLHRAAALAREGVDSPMESRLRMLPVLAGLPEPVVNHIEYRKDGSWERRFDLAYPEHRLAVVYDGRQHAESQRQWEHDVDRREGLDTDGWRLVVVLAKGIYQEPERTLERVTAALREVGVRRGAASDEWRLHFPGH